MELGSPASHLPPSLGICLWCPRGRFHLFIILCILSIYLFYFIPYIHLSTYLSVRPSEYLNVRLALAHYQNLRMFMNFDFFFAKLNVWLVLFCFVHYLAPCSYFHIQGVLIEFFFRAVHMLAFIHSWLGVFVPFKRQCVNNLRFYSCLY